MRVVGYLRVSTKAQRDGQSLAVQEMAIAQWAQTRHGQRPTLFREAASGGSVKKRPQLQAAIAALEPGDLFVVYDLSRMSRSTIDSINIATAVLEAGAELVSINDLVDTSTAAGRHWFRSSASQAEYQRERIVERTCESLALKRSRGEKLGGSVPFGFRSRNGKLIRIPREQEAIRLARELRDTGLTLRAVGEALAERGFRTKAGSLNWHPESVKNVLADWRVAT